MLDRPNSQPTTEERQIEAWRNFLKQQHIHSCDGMWADIFCDLALKGLSSGPDDVAKDAVRYRWLRAKARTGTGEPWIARSFLSGISAWTGEFADDAIDAAMSAATSEAPGDANG